MCPNDYRVEMNLTKYVWRVHECFDTVGWVI